MTIEQRVRVLAPLRFQALALLLLRREFGDAFEDVRDTAGEGNGCDGVLVRADHVEGFQVRTVEREFADTQKRKAREAVELALKTIPQERGLPLTEFMFVLNLDLQPSEAKWFADQKAKYEQQGCKVRYRSLGWTVSQFLDDKNAGIRREFVETESDRQLEIVRAINSGGQASKDALAAIVQLVQGLGASDEAKRALETLLERARFHFEAGLERLVATESFQAAVVALAEARELLKRHQEDPLYTDVVYWHAVALLRANAYKAALEAFGEAGALGRRPRAARVLVWIRATAYGLRSARPARSTTDRCPYTTRVSSTSLVAATGRARILSRCYRNPWPVTSTPEIVAPAMFAAQARTQR